MSLGRTSLAPLVVLAALLACTAIGVAQASAFSFGNGGRVVTSFGPADARAAGIASRLFGRTVVAGTASNGANDDIVVAAYDEHGRLDRGFAGGGKLRIDLGGDEQATDVAVDGEGRIVVAGYAGFRYTPALDEALVVRLLPDGRLDPGFGEGGVAHAGKGGAQAVTVGVTNRPVISGGVSLGPFDNPWRVARLTVDGKLDPSFGGGDGEVTGYLYAEDNYAEDVVTDSQGRVYFAACGQNAETPPVFAAGRLLIDGTVDKGFGESGLTKVEFGNSYACGRSIDLDYRERVLVGGNGNHRLLAARLRTDGRLDRSFAGDGTVSLRFRKSEARLGRIAVDIHNRVVLAARIEPDFPRGAAYPARFLLVRLRADGRRDPNFAAGGDVAFRFGKGKAYDAEATSVALISGSVFAAGSILPNPPTAGSDRFGLLRYDPREHRWPGKPGARR